MAGKKISQLSSGSLSNLPLSGLTAVVYSGITYQHSLSNLRQILVDSGSHVFSGSQVINGNLTISGSITAQQYILSSSITNITTETISGSSNFGNSLDDTHRFTGSVNITGSLSSSKINIGPAINGLSGSEYTAAHISTSGSINIAHFEGNNQYYAQVNITNKNSSSLASSDLVITADNGTETVHFVNLGMNSSTYNGGYVGYENDAYLLNVGKDLYIGTVGGTSHPAELKLFANNSWVNPQITIHTGSQITFNTGSFTNGYAYEFNGDVKVVDEINVVSVYSDTNLNLVTDGNSVEVLGSNFNVPNGGISTGFNISASGSVTASYFVGDGSQLTNLPFNTGSFAITGSNIFIGKQIVSGAIETSGNNYINSIGIDGTGKEYAELHYTSGSIESFVGAFNQHAYMTFNDGVNANELFVHPNLTKFSKSLLVTGSVTAGNFTGSLDWIHLINVPTLVSGSSQIEYSGLTGIPSGLVSGSSQILEGSGIWSGSSQLPSGLVSGSSQIGNLGYAITGSNTFIGDQTINGTLIIEGVSEVLTVDGGFSGNRTFDYTSGSIFYLTGLTGNGIWNIENVPTTNNKTLALTYVIEQGATAYSGSQYQINGSNVTVKWVDNTIPTGSANNTEIIGLTAFRVGSSWNVIGSLSTFGI